MTKGKKARTLAILWWRDAEEISSAEPMKEGWEDYIRTFQCKGEIVFENDEFVVVNQNEAEEVIGVQLGSPAFSYRIIPKRMLLRVDYFVKKPQKK